MINSITSFNYKKALNSIDWKLLLFLLLFLNVKLAIKIPAIILIYLLQLNFRFGFSLKNSRLPLFYLLVIVIAFANLFILGNYARPHYWLTFLTGTGFWLLCILAVHQVKLSVENNGPVIIHQTILVFFVINAVVSFLNIAQIIWETGAINPYTYQGEYQKYFIGTGDYIKGLSFDTSTTNAVLNAFGVIYFLSRKNAIMVLVCMVVLLLTGSNFINILLTLILVALFLLSSNRNQKSVIVICLVLLVLFMGKISPQNNNYVAETIKNTIHPQKAPFASVAGLTSADSQLTTEGRRRQFARQYLDSVSLSIVKKQHVVPRETMALPVLKTKTGRIYTPKPDINTPPYQTPTDTTAEQRRLLLFIGVHKDNLPLSGKANYIPGLPGKAIAFLQTLQFFRQHPVKAVAGDGMGNFSSKLAFKATALGFEGGYPTRYIYISREFLLNNLDVYLNFFSKRSELHSLTNSPFSVYNQLLAEYGLIGLAAFIFFYLGYFFKYYKRLTYGIPLLALMLAVFLTDYWFEQLSVLVFFELLLLLNIKETLHLKPANDEHN